MTVLILADERDPQADYMVGTLSERGVALCRIDTAWFPAQLSVTATLRGGGSGVVDSPPPRTRSILKPSPRFGFAARRRTSSPRNGHQRNGGIRPTRRNSVSAGC